ncbi:hypothetical protein HDU96_001518, partial [Phlyctochytrium bullatum]
MNPNAEPFIPQGYPTPPSTTTDTDGGGAWIEAPSARRAPRPPSPSRGGAVGRGGRAHAWQGRGGHAGTGGWRAAETGKTGQGAVGAWRARGGEKEKDVKREEAATPVVPDEEEDPEDDDDEDDDDEDEDEEEEATPTTSHTRSKPLPRRLDPTLPPPTSDPRTFWDPTLVFHCPLPDCPPDTDPTTDPVKALSHLRVAHDVHVRDPDHVMPYLERYIAVWAKRMREGRCTGRGVGLGWTTGRGGEKTVDEEDMEIRRALQREKLNEKLQIQDRERRSDALEPRRCLFCRHPCPDRATLFRHMFSEHGFNIGLPDNLVEVQEFLEILHGKLAKFVSLPSLLFLTSHRSLQCLYCEKTFKTAAVLRKHMRKKKHFKINPRNHTYDRFYLVNYLEPGKNWENFEGEAYCESEEEE